MEIMLYNTKAMGFLSKNIKRNTLETEETTTEKFSSIKYLGNLKCDEDYI